MIESVAEERTAARSVRIAATQGAVVWWSYGLVETAFLVAVPLTRQAASRIAPALVPPTDPPFVSTALTAILLLVFPAIGATLGALQAGLCSLLRSRRPSFADASLLWSAVAILTLTFVFGLNVLWTRQMPVLVAVAAPVVLAGIRLMLAWRPGPHATGKCLTHPWPVLAVLVGTAFIAEPRPGVGRAIPAALGLVYTAGVLLVSLLLCRLLRGRPPRKRHRRPLPEWMTVVLFSGVAIAATLPQNTSRQYVERTAAPPRPGDHRPNVVLITWDTVRADHLSLYGYERDTTPFLEQLAGTVTVYRNAIATSNWTLPTHASIFTGRTARNHGAHLTSKYPGFLPMSQGCETMAEFLSQAGYRTAGIAANSGYLIPPFGFDRGFSHYAFPLYSPFLPIEGRAYLIRASMHALLASLFNRDHPDALFVSADVINERADRFLESVAGRSQPFFLFLNYMDAHAPYVPPPPFRDRYPGRDPKFDWASFSRLFDKTKQFSRPPQARELRHLTSQYDGAIAYLDDRLKLLFETLEKSGLYDNSLIIVMSDHGEAFGERGLLFHTVSVYQHQVHVPLIVKFPHSAAGATVDTLVSDVDLLPTVLDVVGARIPPDIEGLSLRHIQSAGPRWIYSESDELWKVRSGAEGSEPAEVAVLSGFLKQISRRGVVTELYDLSTDPFEARDLHKERELPGEWAAALSHYLARRPSDKLESPVTDPEAIRRLRALGYLR